MKRKSHWPMLSHFVYSVRYRGLKRTLQLAFMEWRKERSLGIHTFGICEPQHIAPNSQCAGGYLYLPSGSELFRKVMELLPVNPTSSMFVDIGSGKGRAMILAAEAGFKKVIGVEYDRELNREARNNIRSVKSRFPNTEFVIRELDALEYEFDPDVNVIYLFNPFDARTLSVLTERLRPLTGNRSPIYLAYVHPLHAEVIDHRLGQPIWTVSNAKHKVEAAIYRIGQVQ